MSDDYFSSFEKLGFRKVQKNLINGAYHYTPEVNAAKKWLEYKENRSNTQLSIAAAVVSFLSAIASILGAIWQ